MAEICSLREDAMECYKTNFNHFYVIGEVDFLRDISALAGGVKGEKCTIMWVVLGPWEIGEQEI